ncbi:methylated-DNA--[protein]-cysteine S-methyltransferase [Bordetella genomosp. 5]|uniref:Methylated-DNA--protein-cysteine methyltransferase n=1 Tax=Bordetella genomosp. 5 TaxID=1395608 RepID=A0A261TJ97_9BORD|nr:methylated-DNA--[protein]-cysteine S-methyltransferase [Bordetella genomosp. 5]OZI49272.1 cysteine methyltransferase [Bordetella genomosp. 5]
MPRLEYLSLDTPVGTLRLIARGDLLAAVLWPDERPGRVPLDAPLANPAHPVLQQARTQLQAYFAGELRRFDLPLDFAGTAFQQRVWQALLAIPYGQTRSYAEIARQLDAPAAVRAVGAANGRNPLSIIAPCHRVVGSGGALTGFAGGLPAKTWLLRHEGVAIDAGRITRPA